MADFYDISIVQDIPDRTSLYEQKFEHVIKQQYDETCGFASVATLLTFFWDMPLSELDLIQKYGQKKAEAGDLTTSMLDLSLIIQDHGLQTRVFSMDFAQLQQSLTHLKPVIVHYDTKLGHFAVLLSIVNDSVIMLDSSIGMDIMTIAAFKKLWSGNALFVASQTNSTDMATIDSLVANASQRINKIAKIARMFLVFMLFIFCMPLVAQQNIVSNEQESAVVDEKSTEEHSNAALEKIEKKQILEFQNKQKHMLAPFVNLGFSHLFTTTATQTVTQKYAASPTIGLLYQYNNVLGIDVRISGELQWGDGLDSDIYISYVLLNASYEWNLGNAWTIEASLFYNMPLGLWIHNKNVYHNLGVHATIKKIIDPIIAFVTIGYEIHATTNDVIPAVITINTAFLSIINNTYTWGLFINNILSIVKKNMVYSPQYEMNAGFRFIISGDELSISTNLNKSLTYSAQIPSISITMQYTYYFD